MPILRAGPATSLFDIRVLKPSAKHLKDVCLRSTGLHDRSRSVRRQERMLIRRNRVAIWLGKKISRYRSRFAFRETPHGGSDSHVAAWPLDDFQSTHKEVVIHTLALQNHQSKPQFPGASAIH